MGTDMIVCLIVLFGACHRTPDRSHKTPDRNRSIAGPLQTWQESPEFVKDYLIVSRRFSTTVLCELIPGSKMKKFYAIQYDTNPDKHPGPDWQPLYVVVWKAEYLESISFDPLEINGHLVRLPTEINVIYVLQPDYSLQKIPLTANETTQLFSHITDTEKQNDKHIASLINLINQQDPQWYDKVSAGLDEEKRFPSNSYWQEEVDPHLKVVGGK